MQTNKPTPLFIRRSCMALAFVWTCWLCAAAAQPLPTAGALPAGQPAPSATEGQGPSALKFRDPSAPLTIGEISDLQQQKEEADFLKAHGFTTQKPKATPPAQASAAQPSKPARPTLSVAAVAVFGDAQHLSAEAWVNGSLRKLQSGDTLGPGVVVERVVPGALHVLWNASGKERHGKAAKKPSVRHTIAVGQRVEVPL